LSPVVDHVDECAEAFVHRVSSYLIATIAKDGHYNPRMAPSCLTFAAVEGCTNYENAVERTVKLAIVRSNSTGNPKNKDFENLMCFRGSDGKNTFTPYHNYIDAQLKVFGNVRGSNVQNAVSKKKLYDDIKAFAKADVQAWVSEQISTRQAAEREQWKRSLLDELGKLVQNIRTDPTTWLKNAQLPSQSTPEGYQNLLFNLLLVVQKQKGFSMRVLDLFGFVNTTEHEYSHMISGLLCAIQKQFKVLRIPPAQSEKMTEGAMTEISATMEDRIVCALPEVTSFM